MTDDVVSAAEQQIVDRAIEFAREVIDPGADRWERDRQYALEAFRATPGADLTARLCGYIDGTTGIQNVVIARRLWAAASTTRTDRGSGRSRVELPDRQGGEHQDQADRPGQ